MRKIELPFRVKRPILACGADMKGAFAIAKGDIAYLFDGFGDLSDLDNFTKYEKAVKGAVNRLKIRPGLIACDLHPGYFSTRFAEEFCTGYLNKDVALQCSRYQVQHHEAHVASCIVDNNIKGEVFAAAFDGTGYGWDGKIWGGEFFKGSVKDLRRAAHLDYIPMPGGEACVREPWRMAASCLYAAFGKDFLKLKIDLVKSINKAKWAVLKDMIYRNVNSPLTSSMGRLFDAAGSIVLNKREARFEAELPIALEKISAKDIDNSYGAEESLKIIRGIVRDLEKKVDPSAISAKFHNSIAGMILDKARISKVKRVVLSGGVFQNKYLKENTVKLLSGNGFKVYTHSSVDTNDSGIPIGQVAIAHARALCA
jgi:hydrogenase maturation protein HypF